MATCEGCNSSHPGIRYPAEPSCFLTEEPPESALFVERCDECCRYRTDEDAAAALASALKLPIRAIRSVECRDGFRHLYLDPEDW